MQSQPPPEIRYLALGDSYTIGEGVAREERWPSQLVELVRASTNLKLSDPEIIAQTGWTAGELLEAVGKSAVQGLFNLVSLLIGVNNQYRGEPPGAFEGHFCELLDLAVRLAGGVASRVIVLSIPDWGVTPFAEGRDRPQIANEIDAFNAVARAQTFGRGADWIDVTGDFRSAAKKPGMLTSDQLHPSGLMYRRWAELALPVAQRILV